LKVRSDSEEYIFTLDSTYGKCISDLKHEGERDAHQHQEWSFFRYGKTFHVKYSNIYGIEEKF
jgi:hypothetical protein